MKNMGTLESIFIKKFWNIKEGLALIVFVVLNPMIIVVIEGLWGFQFLCGIIVGIAGLVALKTRWNVKEWGIFKQ